jgi:hypothetical protein
VKAGERPALCRNCNWPTPEARKPASSKIECSSLFSPPEKVAKIYKWFGRLYRPNRLNYGLSSYDRRRSSGVNPGRSVEMPFSSKKRSDLTLVCKGREPAIQLERVGSFCFERPQRHIIIVEGIEGYS